MTTPTKTRRDALLERLTALAPMRASIFGENADTATERRVATALAAFMEKYRWECPCGNGPEISVCSNLDAPIPDAGVTLHDDEGRPVLFCGSCDEELDLTTLKPLMRWHVAVAGTFVVVRDDGTYITADEYEAARTPISPTSTVVHRYRPTTDPAAATERAALIMVRDPECLVQVIPEVVPA